MGNDRRLERAPLPKQKCCEVRTRIVSREFGVALKSVRLAVEIQPVEERIFEEPVACPGCANPFLPVLVAGRENKLAI